MLRRDFVQLGALPLLRGVRREKREARCILLMLVGGPSHLDTWDMKPDAPREIRGPFRPIRTNVPGVEISEIFPRMAKHADKYALIRSVSHDAAPVHDTGHQLMQTGRLFGNGPVYPHLGSVLEKLGAPKSVILPHPIGNTGGNMPHGQSAGFLGSAFEPILERSELNFSHSEKYGRSRFGQSCFRARQLVESGARFVTVNMFETVFDELTWDIHGSKPFSPISCYRDSVGPMFDMAYSALLEDLSERGLLETTLVVATGEFGRTPRINPAGGRDHWPQCWTIIVAGGGIKGGQVYGSSDRIGSEPRDNPVSPAMVVATICHALGVAPDLELRHPDGHSMRLLEPRTQPLYELFT
jgi:Protein of unknown function (DUF1501)